MKSVSITAIAQALLAAALFGASAPLSKLLLGKVDPIALAGLLYLGSGLGSWLLYGLRRARPGSQKTEAKLSRADLPWLIGAILAGGVGAPILLLLGLDRTPASTAALLLNFESAATAVIAALVFHEAVDRRILGAVGLITLASILLTWSSGTWGISLGALGVIGACLLWGLDNNFTRQISAKDPLIIVGIKGLGAGSFSLALALLLGNPLPGLVVIGLALLVGAICYGLSIQLFILALRGLGAARTGALFGTAPFIGAALAILFLGEKPQGLFWAAMPVMLFGAGLMLTERHEHAHVHEPAEHTHTHDHDDEHHLHEHQEEESVPANGKHSHAHKHEGLVHDHVHAPDLHHRHGHGDEAAR